MAATPTPSSSSITRESTTCHARPIASRSRAWPPRRRPCATPRRAKPAREPARADQRQSAGGAFRGRRAAARVGVAGLVDGAAARAGDEVTYVVERAATLRDLDQLGADG